MVARMEGAYLSGARMEGAVLGGARMEGADLSGARMEGAELYERVWRVLFFSGRGWRGRSSSGAVLKSAEAERCPDCALAPQIRRLYRCDRSLPRNPEQSIW